MLEIVGSTCIIIKLLAYVCKILFMEFQWIVGLRGKFHMMHGVMLLLSTGRNECQYCYLCMHYAKQKHLGCKKGEANQKQQLSDYKSIHSYTCD